MQQSVTVALAVTFLLAGPAVAQEVEVDFKSMLSGRLPAEGTVTQQGPFTVVSIPIPEDRLSMLRAMSGIGDSANDAISTTKVFPLTVGASILTPRFRGGLVTNDASPLEFTSYYYYYVFANFNSNILTRQTTFKLKGPGQGFVFSGLIDYDAASIILLWVLSDPAVISGIYNLDVKIKGGGKAKGKVCIGC